MQRTRLDSLVSNLSLGFQNFFANPWRSVSLILISILFGFFMGLAINSTAGQAAWWDVPGSGLILIFTETVSRWVYFQKKRSLWVNVINVFKIGVIYSFLLQAFMLGS